jgi:predicted PhzF superfamily epimerase YddE/YHI9
VSTALAKALGVEPVEYYKGNYYLAVFENEEEIIHMQPDFQAIADLKVGGLIVSAPGKEVDFVSRFFAPEFGINEDPVTGSAHTLLTPFWAKRFGKTSMLARQLSQRGGTLFCEDHGSRVKISGNAQLFMIGEIFI